MRNLLIVLVLLGAGVAGCLGGDDDAPDPSDATQSDGPFSPSDVFPGEYRTDLHRTLEEGPYDVLSEEVTYLTSDLDGIDLMVHVARPDVGDDEKVPVVLVATPYFFPTGRTSETFVHNIVSHGYAMAFHAVRGTGDSGGCGDVFGPGERADIDQVIKWLGTREWSNGNVGMYGGSYEGGTQWVAAASGNPHLKTIVPIVSMPSAYHLMYYNGTQQGFAPFGQLSAFYWLIYGPVSYNPSNGRSVQHTVENVACESGATAVVAGTLATLQPDDDTLGYWEERDWRDEVLENYRGTVFLQHGLYDVTVEPHSVYPFVNELEERGVVVKHLVGPWGHELPWRADWAEILLHWYDRWLKEDETVDIGPKAHVQDNLGNWRRESTWPPADSSWATYNLTPDGELTNESTEKQGDHLSALMVPAPDPDCVLSCLNGMWRAYDRPLATLCPSCPTFSTGTLEEDLRFAGAPLLRLETTPTGPGGLVTAVLLATAPDGTSHRVGYGQSDLRFADGGDEAKSVTPGERLQVNVLLEPLDVVVPGGWSLDLWLHQGGYGMRAPTTVPFPIQIHTGPDESLLKLPVIDPDPEAFFDAPPRVGGNTPPR